MDATFAAILLLTGILVMSVFLLNEENILSVEPVSEDVAAAVSNVKVQDLNNSLAAQMVALGQLETKNRSIVEEVGRLWSENNTVVARDLLENLTEGLVPEQFGYGFYINGDPIYESNITETPDVLISTKRLISGIAKDKPFEGFSSRLVISDFDSRTTRTYGYYGGFEGQGNLSKKLFLAENITTINEAYLEGAVSNNFSLFINGQFAGHYIIGSAGGGALQADKWTLNDSYLSLFQEGENEINVTFNESGFGFFGGGFIRVTYNTPDLNDTTVMYAVNDQLNQREWLPGIIGFVNLFSSLYVPGTIQSMSAMLHYESNLTTFVNIGNTTVYVNSSGGELFLPLTNAHLDSLLDYNDLSDVTVPIRVASTADNISVTQGLGNGDIFLVNDLSGSMQWCAEDGCSTSSESLYDFCGSYDPWSASSGSRCDNYDEEYTLPSTDQLVCSSKWHSNCIAPDIPKIESARNATRAFINTVTNTTGNRMGLVEYTDSDNRILHVVDNFTDFDYHPIQLEDDLTNLNNWNVDPAWDQNGCSPAGCAHADNFGGDNLQLTNGLDLSDSFAGGVGFQYRESGSLESSDCLQYELYDGSSWSSTGTVFCNDVGSSYLQATITLGSQYMTDDFRFRFTGTNFGGSGEEVYVDDFVAYATYSAGWHNIDTDDYDWTLDSSGTPSSNTGPSDDVFGGGNYIYFETSDPVVSGDEAILVSMEIDFDENVHETISFYYHMYGASMGTLYLEQNTSGSWSSLWSLSGNQGNQWLNTSVDLSGLTGTGNLRFRGVDSTSYQSDFALDNIDLTWSQVGYGQTDPFPDGIVGSQPLTGNNITLLDHVDKFMNHTFWGTCICCGVLEAHSALQSQAGVGRNWNMVVMSDGIANEQCPSVNTGSSSGDAIQAAQDACTDDNITVYTVGFGSDVDESTLQSMTACGGEYYFADNASALIDAFNQIASQIVSLTFVEQEITVSGNNTEGSLSWLYPDSYIEINYTPSVNRPFGTIPFRLESDRLGNNVTNGTLNIPQNITVERLSVTSYSDQFWTDNVTLTNANGYWQVFELGLLSTNYIPLGDPYLVDVPAGLVIQGDNHIHVSTGFSPVNATGGSIDDRFIYTISAPNSVGYGGVFSVSDGCQWFIAFEDSTNATITVPQTYNGSNQCNFQTATYNYQDSFDDAAFRLFSLYDFDDDGLLDITFADEDLAFDAVSQSGVPSLWGPSVFEVRVWQ